MVQKIIFNGLLISLICISVTVNIYTQDYFPLQIGNKWVYERLEWPGSYKKEINDTISINNKVYFQFQSEHPDLDWYPRVYYRKDSLNQVWFLGDTANPEYIEYKLDVPVGSFWYIYGDYLTSKATLVDTNWTQPTPAGIFERCYYYTFDFESIHTRFDDWLAPDIGIIRSEGELVGSILKGACINGILYGDTTTTEIKNGKRTELVRNCFLYQNFPNPFNPYTSIRFDLDKACEIRLDLYDIGGRLVKTIADGSYKAGRYTVKLDGTELASGIYFIKLNILSRVNHPNSKAFTKKIMLLK